MWYSSSSFLCFSQLRQNIFPHRIDYCLHICMHRLRCDYRIFFRQNNDKLPFTSITTVTVCRPLVSPEIKSVAGFLINGISNRADLRGINLLCSGSLYPFLRQITDPLVHTAADIKLTQFNHISNIKIQITGSKRMPCHIGIPLRLSCTYKLTKVFI